MDYVLSLADNIVLDKVYAALLPAHVFYPPPTTNSTTVPFGSAHSNPWLSLVAHLPHPSPQSFLYAISLPPAYETPSFLRTLDSPPPTLSAWPRTYIPRQLLSLSIITLIGIHVLYFLFATLSYYFIFNHKMMKHPRFLKNQIRKEILCSLKGFPGMTLLTLPFFQAEVLGYSRLYDDLNKYGYGYMVFSVFFFLVFTDYCIYWIHRWLHHPLFYKRLHKPHHKWIIPTPFASHAFHFCDGFAQSIPYHVFIMLFPLHRFLYLGLFVAINFWTIFIHDSDMITGHPLEHVINGPAHHTLHHMYFTCNYGQYFTWADKAGGSYKHPQSELDPLLEVKELEAKEREVKVEKSQ